MSNKFQFSLGDEVVVPPWKGVANPRRGTVEGRSEYANGTPRQYLVRHVNGQGDEVEVWFHEYQIVLV